jgi:hypothetical protein
MFPWLLWLTVPPFNGSSANAIERRLPTDRFSGPGLRGFTAVGSQRPSDRSMIRLSASPRSACVA